jgi:streptogramin lyase
MRPAVVLVPLAAVFLATGAGLAARDDPRPPGARPRVVRVRPEPPRHLHARRLDHGLPGAPVSVVSARDARVWLLLGTRHGVGRIGRLDPRGSVALLRARLPAPVELVDGLEPSPYLGFAAAGQVGAVNTFGLITVAQPAAGPAGVAFDRFGRLWYASRPRSSLVRLDPVHGTRREVAVPGGARLGDIATIRDGTLVVRDERGRVGTLDDRGGLTWAPAVRRGGTRMPTGSTTGDPAAGAWTTWPDGSLVRTGGGARLTVRLPRSFGAPRDVVAGADGNVWVAPAAGPRLARVTPTAHVDLYRLPLPRRVRIVDLARRPGELLVATRRPGAVYAVPLPGLRALAPA